MASKEGTKKIEAAAHVENAFDYENTKEAAQASAAEHNTTFRQL